MTIAGRLGFALRQGGGRHHHGAQEIAAWGALPWAIKVLRSLESMSVVGESIISSS